MRIRKRPLPIHPSPMVQLPRASSPKSSAPLLLQPLPHTTASPSDHPRPLLDDAGDSSVIGAHDHHAHLDRSDEAGEGGERRNDTGKGVVLGSGTFSEVVIPPSPSHGDGKWCDEEKAIPPKKRRGRGGGYMMMNTRESNNNNNKRMKTKMNKKCTTQNEDETSEEEEVNTSKKRGRGSVVMEGSRCSRVNGRGWRCCQQTLVGYSLCEHHLGKGRLRSITSVRNRSIPSTTAAATKNNDSLSEASSSSPENKSKDDSSGIHNDVDEDKPEKKPAGITKKRMKLGMVKARSIRSLLGQTDTLVTLHENNK
ncbi:hypothetical protein QN277_013259 [Acacia crassicarpa]|uniref:WRC domain-containing protein n=1 Tax=Acacia crassicarpa TaxID=499986 RepID=A0AAE1TDW4_9FABA|nr:hypothetical protein QN277_013259 [Acacia crassicarpa]